ncbi:MAG: YebC/PmpR family DNA-binding transcriptional regulator [Bacilli bacterium]|jgi:YebC/PmpR family DNA-binding regulatory protein
MSGHSKWSTIKRKKAAIDASRSKVFQKLAREIYVFAKQGDKDPKNNPNLRMIIEKARSFNMPLDNIQRAIDKAHGSAASGESYESIRYEGYGPAGIAVMVDVLTDNRNRTAAQIRATFTKYGGNLGTDGSVSYLFEKRGTIVIPNTYDEDKIMMNVIENGALDFHYDGENCEIITNPEDFINVKEGLSKLGVEEYIVSEVSYVPKVAIEVDQKSYEKVNNLLEALDELDDVQDVYHNMKEL